MQTNTFLARCLWIKWVWIAAVSLPLTISVTSYGMPKTGAILFADDFSSPSPHWNLESGFEIPEVSGNHLLQGEGHYFARLLNLPVWRDYKFSFRVKLIYGEASAHFRLYATSIEHRSYSLSMREGHLSLWKDPGYPNPGRELDSFPAAIFLKQWHTIAISISDCSIRVSVDGSLLMEVNDISAPLPFGSIAFQTQDLSKAQFDDVLVQLENSALPVSDVYWVRTGGPNGGLGYDIRIHPRDPKVMFVTDNPSGVNKSYDGGKTWIQRNQGIRGDVSDISGGAPIFSLTIDPSNPNIVWAGTQNFKGVFRSGDGGETWTRKDNGIVEGNEISFRGFAVNPSDSNTVFAAAEIKTGTMGRTFGKSKGKIYRSLDGGENWSTVWEGDSLARVIIFNPENPRILYCSTGIWDVEAFNDIGVGVLKSTDGGESWIPINNGLNSLYVGFLEMHPSDPNILFAAAGEGPYLGNCGVYRTKNGGENWKLVYSYGDNPFTVVVVSPSNPKIVYAAGDLAFARSDDGGDNWQKLNSDIFGWGPPGIRAGVPIGAVVHPEDPMTVFVNNYTGGNYKSADGGVTWTNSSKGYTGAESIDLATFSQNARLVYTVGRSGPFRSDDYGKNWTGVAFEPARQPEWHAVALNPINNQEVLMSDQLAGLIFKSTNGGLSWRTVLKDLFSPDTLDESTYHGFKAIVYAPSDPRIVYAGAIGWKLYLYPGASLGVYKSMDGGENWSPMNNGLGSMLININCVAVHPTDPNTVYIGTWQDGIYKTTNGGESWEERNNGLLSMNVLSLALNPDTPETIYAGLGEGLGIMMSKNGGDSWYASSAGLEIHCPSYLMRVGQTTIGESFEHRQRFASRDYSLVPWTAVTDLLVDPSAPNVVYAADQFFGVYRSTSGGETWDTINNGLTTLDVTSLSLAGEHVLYATTRGGGVFRLAPNLSIDPDLTIRLPCAEFNGGYYSFDLHYSHDLTWALDFNSIRSGAEGACLFLDQDLSIDLSSVELAGKSYGFKMNYSGDLLWQIDLGTVVTN